MPGHDDLDDKVSEIVQAALQKIKEPLTQVVSDLLLEQERLQKQQGLQKEQRPDAQDGLQPANVVHSQPPAVE